MRACWTVNEDTGNGLLKLPIGWTKKTFATASAEIKAAGFVVVPHDDWYVYMSPDSYYRIVRK